MDQSAPLMNVLPKYIIDKNIYTYINKDLVYDYIVCNNSRPGTPDQPTDKTMPGAPEKKRAS